MNRLVVDTNILFSAMLNINSRIGQILTNSDKHFNFFAPHYVEIELHRHKDKIQKMAKISEQEYSSVKELVFKNITVLNHSILPSSSYFIAKKLCHDIDSDDIIFVAFAEFLDARLWTGDIELTNGLNSKGYNNFIDTRELFEEYNRKRGLR